MNPVHPAHRPATPVRTIVLIAAGIVLLVLVLGSALIGGGGGGGGDTSTESGCRTEFFDGGSLTTCDGEVLYSDDNGNSFSTGG